MAKVKSSMIEDVSYDREQKKLSVTFKNGSKYVYTDVSDEQYKEIIGAKSVGQQFSKTIKKSSPFTKSK